MWTTSLISRKMEEAKPAAQRGARARPEKMAYYDFSKRGWMEMWQILTPMPFPPFHPHWTFLAPTVATPTPATAEMREYVDET